MRLLKIRVLALSISIAVALPAAAAEPLARSPAEQELVDADARQRTAVATSDTQAIARIAHPNFLVNAPTNRVLTRDDLVRMVTSGEIRQESFERTPEKVQITGDVGVVMGREVVLPAATSADGKMFGQKPLNRRYTNIYLRQGGAWLHIARHANVVP